MNGSEFEIDENGSVLYVNDSGIPDADIERAVMDQAPEIGALMRWVSNNNNSRNQSIFGRDRYVTPKEIFKQFEVALHAAENDDVVSGVVETTEQLAFKRVAIETGDLDEDDIWSQIIDDLHLENRLREIWRELFVVSQCYVAVLYGRKSYRVNGKTESGNLKKKQFRNILVPTGITLLDPLKVIPVGNFMFNQEQLCYIASKEESKEIDNTLAGKNTSDLIVSQLLVRRYEPSRDELNQIKEITGAKNVDMNLFLLNPDRVFRITSTRPHYQRFASVRMKSVFELLDLKHQLREMDRAHIMGNANYIVLVKKGSDDKPAIASELAQVSSIVRTAAKIPIIISDHRIDIEIITPKLDKTLSPERYNTLDSRITSRLFQVLSSGNYSSGTAADDSIKLLRIVASTMEARRDSIRDSIMENIVNVTYNANDLLKSEPRMQFYPRRVALDFDPNIATYLQDLRDRGDISRETILAELDIIESEEAMKRKREADIYDDIFSPVNVPFSGNNLPQSTPDSNVPQSQNEVTIPTDSEKRAAGRRGGGRTGGGGTNRNSFRTGDMKSPNN